MALAQAKKEHMLEVSEMQNAISMLQMEACSAQRKVEDMQNRHAKEMQHMYARLLDMENKYRRSSSELDYLKGRREDRRGPDVHRHGDLHIMNRSPPSTTVSTLSGTGSVAMTPSIISDHSYLDEPASTLYDTFMYDHDRTEHRKDDPDAPHYNAYTKKYTDGSNETGMFRSNFHANDDYPIPSPHHERYRYGSSGRGIYGSGFVQEPGALTMSDLKAPSSSSRYHDDND